MVSWNDTANANASGAAGIQATTTTTEDDEAESSSSSLLFSQSQYSKEARHLFVSARHNDWDRLLADLKTTCPDVIRNAIDESALEQEEQISSILHVVVTYAKVPVAVVQAILDSSSSLSSSSSSNEKGDFESTVATTQNHLRQTPLHTAVHFIPERTDMVQCLVRAAPETVRHRDVLHLRPIDIICQKIIMMEEVVKYSHHYHHQNYDPQEEEDDDDDDGGRMLNELWDTVHVLAHAFSRSNAKVVGDDDNGERQQDYIVHTCLMGTDFPFALTERAMKRYRIQLQQPNADGDLPLHVIARVSPPPKENEEEEEDDDESDFLDRVVSLYPKAAAQWNLQEQIPLVVAIQSGRGWQSGILRLLDAHPAGINALDMSRGLYPSLFERLLQERGHTSTVFEMIKAKPELFLTSFA